MSHWDIRSFWRDRRSRRSSVRHAGRAAADLAGSAGGIGLGDAGDPLLGRPGRARRGSAPAQIEQLENRVLLAGDHPSFDQVFGPSSAPPTVIEIMGGLGTGEGEIGVNGDDDMFQFTTSADDFVTIRVDTLNDVVSSLDSSVRVFDPTGQELFSGTSNSLAATRMTDGWVGFFAPAGTYYVQVRSDVGTGTKATGDYVVRVDTETDLVDVGTGAGSTTGAIGTPTADQVFRVDIAAEDFITLLADTTATDFGGTPTDLNTRLAVYSPDGDLLFDASGNGTLTGSVTVTPTDAWVGFIAEPGAFYVRVLSDRANMMFGTGAFTLFADVQTDELTVDPMEGNVTENGMLTRLGEDQVFRVTLPNTANFDSLVMIGGLAAAFDLDTHLDLYDADGEAIRSDSTSGNGTNAFAVIPGGRGETIYVRIRSDEIGDPGSRPSTGVFMLTIDASATPAPLDPVTRVFTNGGADVVSNTFPMMWSFSPLLSGVTVAFAQGVGLAPLADPAMTLFRSDGTIIEFVDDLFGPNPQIDSDLQSAETYFVMVDGFDNASGGNVLLNIENVVSLPGQGIDDHANNGDWFNATPIQFSAPGQHPGTVGAFGTGHPLGYPNGPITDHTTSVVGYARGRIYDNGDTDIFQITPQIDMWGIFAGHEALMPAMMMQNGEPFDPSRWEDGILPATRLQILVRGNIDGTLSPSISVYRSDVLRAATTPAPIAGPNTGVLTAAGGPWTGTNWRAGFLDPAAFPPELVIPLGDPIAYQGGAPMLGGANTIAAWGGEPLFLEIDGTGTGTYEVWVVADAMPDEAAAGQRPGNISQINEEYGLEPGDTLFNASDPRELSFGTSGGGDAVFAGGFDGFFNASGGVERLFFYGDVMPPTPAPPIPIGMGSANTYGPASPGEFFPGYGGATVLRETTLNSIERIDDKDTYRFRATGTGTTEIRINTTELTNGYMEYWANGLERVTDPMTGMPDGPADYEEFTTDDIGDRATYDSLLDATIRIYNADFEQIAFNDDSGIVRGDTQFDEVGTLDGPFNGDYLFYQRDPRVVFDVEEGETYYVVVESGQKYIDGSAQGQADRVYATSDGTASGQYNTEFIDWRTATGTYELLINSMPRSPLGPAGATQLAQGDDHIDFLDPLTNGLNVFDAVATQATVLLVQPDGSINANAFTSASAGEYAGTVTNRGTTRDTDLFTFVASSTGAATITLSRPTGSTLIPSFTITDFFGGQVASATASSLGTITGTFAVTQGERYFVAVGGGGGSQGRFTLELSTPAPEDDHADINKFENATVLDIQDFLGGGTATGDIEDPGDTDVFTFQAFTTQDVTVTITPTSALDPILDIYEIQEDDVVGAPVVRRIASATLDTGYTTTFTMTRDRISTVTTSRYDQYFMVVRGANPAIDSGAYAIAFEFEPTDDHADEEQLTNPATRSLATTLLADTGTGRGERDGDIEFFYDSDLFVYIAPAGGPAIFTADPVDASGLQPRLAVFDSTGTLIAESDPFVTTPVTVGVDVERGQPYYVVVRPSEFLFTGGVPNNASDPRLTGEYRLSVDGPAVDDHANQGEFDRATVITLDSATGDASVGSATQGAAGNPEIDPAIDTDLFQFSPRDDGQVIVRVVSVGNSQLRPSMTIFRQDGPGQYTQIGATSRTDPGLVQININDANSDASYFVLVEDVFNSRSGEYRLTIDGPAGGGGTNDPAAVNFAMPDADIVLNPLTGDGSFVSAIDIQGDRDLFTFTALGSGPVFIQVVAPDGSTLNASVTVLSMPNENAGSVVATDATGIPGVTANVAFGGSGSPVTVNEGQQFWVIVDGVGVSTGGYTLRIDSTPASFATSNNVDFRHRLYFPAGFAGNSINEFIPIANPGDQAANYRVVLYYETGEQVQILRESSNGGVRSIAPGARAGVQLSQRGVGARLDVRQGVGYSVVIESDQPLAASLSRFDFGVTTGEAFTSQTSASWFFPRVERQPGAVSDFITLYNPNNFSLNVVLTAYTEDGQQIVIERRGSGALPANRRGGFAIDNLDQLPIGTFAVKIETSPRNSANNDDFIGIVGAMTHFNEAEGHGFSTLGDPDGGAVAGAITNVTRGNGTSSQIAIFNPGAASAVVNFVGSYFAGSLPDFERSFQVAAGSVRFVTAAQLGLTNNQSAGVRFTSNLPVAILTNQVRRGDADAALASTQAGTTAFFGAAYLTPALAGVNYFENLSIYNPAGQSINVSVQFLFTNGNSTTTTVNVAANDFRSLELHTLSALLTAPGRTPEYSMIVTSSSPFASSFSRYDLGLGGGWATNGAPFGLYNPISAILA